MKLAPPELELELLVVAPVEPLLEVLLPELPLLEATVVGVPVELLLPTEPEEVLVPLLPVLAVVGEPVLLPLEVLVVWLPELLPLVLLWLPLLDAVVAVDAVPDDEAALLLVLDLPDDPHPIIATPAMVLATSARSP